ncbi:hypothetical protein HK097_007160 [Rhizophlyctis rosea]|uniref:Uncharacterized protein n=1 Tax=Rhizophlyctis rosea TaxID=64517 RepID=A0AAD5X4S4_9FUNG|nr:hypothetical protein HK097_007160 [Rhizophlyctis rosea]
MSRILRTGLKVFGKGRVEEGEFILDLGKLMLLTASLIYENSFLNPKVVNGNLLGEVSRVCHLLHIENSSKTYSRTSYKTGYMLCPPIEPLIQQQQQGPALSLTNSFSLRTVVPKAIGFGDPFLVWHPVKYATMIAEHMRKHQVDA